MLGKEHVCIKWRNEQWTKKTLRNIVKLNNITLRWFKELWIKVFELKNRVHEDEYNRYQANLRSLEQRMRVIEEGRELLNRRNEECLFNH